MPTTVRSRRTAFNPVATFAEHLALKTDAKRISTRSEALKKRLKEWMPTAPGKYVNDKGSIFVDLPEVVHVGGKAYGGMEMRRSVSTSFNEEKAAALLERKSKKDPKIVEEATSTVTYIDQDKIAALQQAGRITEKEVDSLFDDDESFAFWPVEADSDEVD